MPLKSELVKVNSIHINWQIRARQGFIEIYHLYPKADRCALQYNEHILWKRLCHMIEWNPLGLYFDIAVSISIIFH